jgi:hypothetical protein
MSWAPGTKRQSRIGSLGQLRREPPGSICSRAKPSFAPASLALNLFARSLLLCIRTCLRERAKPAVSPASRVRPVSHCSCFDLRTDKESSPCVPPPSSSRLTAAFAPQLLFPTCRAISASPSGSPCHKRSRITIRGLSRPTSSTRHGRTLEGSPGCHAVCRQAAAEPISAAPLLPCACFCRTHIRCLLLLFLLISWIRTRPGLVAPQLHPCTPVPRASLDRVARVPQLLLRRRLDIVPHPPQKELPARALTSDLSLFSPLVAESHFTGAIQSQRGTFVQFLAPPASLGTQGSV